jgi:hypothetical protein
MHPVFREHVDSLQPSFERLLEATPFRFDELREQRLPERGIYLFTEADVHLYVGRSDGIAKRLRHHCAPGATHLQAAFAFRLAREATGQLKASYKPEGSRAHLMTQEAFKTEFDAQKARLRRMHIRVVQEDHPIRQALLEMYAALALASRYNEFGNH